MRSGTVRACGPPWAGVRRSPGSRYPKGGPGRLPRLGARSLPAWGSGCHRPRGASTPRRSPRSGSGGWPPGAGRAREEQPPRPRGPWAWAEDHPARTSRGLVGFPSRKLSPRCEEFFPDHLLSYFDFI